MEFIEWHSSFSVGVRVIDEQHQKLFSLINEIIAKIKDVSQREIIEKTLDDLVDYTDYHFKSEEKLLKMHSNFKAHHNTHKQFVDKISEFVVTFKSENVDLKPAILKFLIEWIKKHVLDMDKSYFQELGYTSMGGASGSKEEGNNSRFSGKILVVDDSMDQRFLLRAMLEKEFYKVLEAKNGAEALEACNKNPDIRVVITDLNMPEMDGYELILALRKHQIRYLYIIVITAASDKKSLIQALSSGADDFLIKPITPKELFLRIQSGQQLLKFESQDELIFSMAKLSDYRSEETGLHLERVRKYTFEIGRYLVQHYPEKGVNNQMADEISKVSPLHDIGKVGIKDAILAKPGRLTEEEFEIMKEHSQIGGELISDIYLKIGSPNLRIAFELTMYHHEKWNGTGYPAGLSGNGIPIAARIMALADVYDALTTRRVYKKPFSQEKSRKIIIEGKGLHFDPDLVDVFLALEDRFIELKEKFCD